MYTIAENVRIVVALLKAHRISQLVLSPGGTNAPFVRAVQDDPFFTCYSIVDERSAMYFAIGLYLSTGKITATCCTSAQATRNYVPGLTEAFYKHIPILAITFSKHPQYTYQDYMQAPDQTSLPKDSVRKTFALPYISNEHDRLHCIRLVNEAILELTHLVPAPIQLNVPMLDNELGIFTESSLPSVKVIKRYNPEDVSEVSLSDKRVLIVVGENCQVDSDTLKVFAKNHNVAIYVNQLSNIRNEYSFYGNLLLSRISQSVFDEIFCPDILISVGGQTGDYPLYHKLAESKNKYEHWRISPLGNVVDTYDHLTRVFQCSEYHFFSTIKGCSENNYLSVWKEGLKDLTINIDLPLSNAYVAQYYYDKIPSGSCINFSILNTLRTWNFFPMKNEVKCYCNVAAFGIDGCMSTFIGQSVSEDNLCFLIIGDLSFYYDMNSLGIRYIKNNVRIILINNQGGFEFKMGDAKEENERTDRYIAAAGHFKDAKGWALTNNFDYISVDSKNTFDEQASKLLMESDKPILMEVFTSDLEETEAYRAIMRENDLRTNSEKIKGAVKSRIKNVLHIK